MDLEIEPASMKASGRCACCGKSRRTAWGFVYRDGGPHACYFVEWTVGKGADPCAARFDVVVGKWYDGTTEDDRDTISLEYKLLSTGPSFALADAAGRPAAEVGRAHPGPDVAGTDLESEALTIATAVLQGDDRFRELSAAQAQAPS